MKRRNTKPRVSRPQENPSIIPRPVTQNDPDDDIPPPGDNTSSVVDNSFRLLPITPSDIDLWKNTIGETLATTRISFASSVSLPSDPWYTLASPLYKEYPETGPDDISFSAGTENIAKWMATNALSSQTRLYFSELGNSMVEPFVFLSGYQDLGLPPGTSFLSNESFSIVPLVDVFRSLKKHPPCDNLNAHLEMLCNAKMPVPRRGAVKPVIFRTFLSFPPSQSSRAFLFYVKLPTDTGKEHANYVRQVERAKKFYQATEDRSFKPLFKSNESLFITAFGLDGITDNLLAGITFKRTERGCWINYL
jgi:hypothetical protein